MSNKNRVIFYFATIDRPYILDKHNFYVTEARKRIFAQFSESNFDVEAQKKEQDCYKRFDPDHDDEGSICELAHEEGTLHWLALDEMKNTVSLALTAGMFHQFDKKLREKCIIEFDYWLVHKNIVSMIWDISFPKLIEMLEWIGMDIIGKAYYEKIDICRQVVNVYKHGDGHAHQTLSTAHPEYYGNSSIFEDYQCRLYHEQLEVTEEQFIEFADAITDFWNNIPTYRRYSDIRVIPKWISDELIKLKKKTKKL